MHVYNTCVELHNINTFVHPTHYMCRNVSVIHACICNTPKSPHMYHRCDKNCLFILSLYSDHKSNVDDIIWLCAYR